MNEEYKTVAANEVAWYRRYGRFQDRIARDSNGHDYVIGDSSWNNFQREPEFIERAMSLGVAPNPFTQTRLK